MTVDIYRYTSEGIYKKLLVVKGMGRVFAHQRYATDITKALELYTVPHPQEPSLLLPCVAWLTRTMQPSEASWSEDDRHASIWHHSYWRITLLYGYRDDEETEHSSEYAFQQLVDNAVEAFSFDESLGATVGVYRAHPLEVTSIGIGELETTGILCHRAEFTLKVDHYDTN